MNEKEFMHKLSQLAPKTEELLSRGYSSEYAEEFRKSFFIKEKTKLMFPKYSDPLLHLVSNYNTSHLEIGMVTLSRNSADIPNMEQKIVVGLIEVDILAIDKNTRKVELLDSTKPDFVIAQCANSGDQFLDALLLLASYDKPHQNFKREITENQKSENNDAARKRAAECALAAGIPVESNIYEMLLGCS